MPLIDKHAWYITISCIWYNLYPNIIVFIYYNNLMNSSIQINQININTTKHWFKWTKIDVPFFQFQIQIPYWQIYLMPWCASHWEMMTQQSPTDLRFIYRYKSSFTTQIENPLMILQTVMIALLHSKLLLIKWPQVLIFSCIQ